MPTYEYECRACGHTFEEFQSMTAGALRKCPKCRKLKLQRLVGAGAGIIFKGSGFYETDYKRKGESGSAAKGESKSESKSADKSETKSDGSGSSSASSGSGSGSESKKSTGGKKE